MFVIAVSELFPFIQRLFSKLHWCYIGINIWIQLKRKYPKKTKGTINAKGLFIHTLIHLLHIFIYYIYIYFLYTFYLHYIYIITLLYIYIYIYILYIHYYIYYIVHYYIYSFIIYIHINSFIMSNHIRLFIYTQILKRQKLIMRRRNI